MEETYRLGNAASPRRVRGLALALILLGVGLPVLLFRGATQHAFPVPRGELLGPQFRGRAALPAGRKVDVADEQSAVRIYILEPAPAGARFRWMSDGGFSRSELTRDYGGSVTLTVPSGGASFQISLLWFGFVWVRW